MRIGLVVTAFIILGLSMSVAHARTAEQIAAYCRHAKTSAESRPGDDYPGQPIAAWRCMNGHVYVCEVGATGRQCQQTAKSLAPQPGIRQFCRKNPDASYVPNVVIGNSRSTWRCQGTKPIAIETPPVDKQRYFTSAWKRVN